MNDDNEFKLIILFEGYSQLNNNILNANCTCTLIKGPQNVIIDTRTAWDGQQILNALNNINISAEEDIDYVICTHGHSDHIGCNYLFPKAIHIVGFSISQMDKYFIHTNFNANEEYIINDYIKVIPTPGHTMQDVTVIFTNSRKEIFAITGDLFECEKDLEDENIWINAGSDSVDLQRKNREKILVLADFIIPGHGPMFKVNK